MLRHVLYARKSHEDDSRQQKSIGDQQETLHVLAEREDRLIAFTLTEEKSAREPNQRPVFDEMIRLIQNGEADAILCYHINRLTRNMVEGGILQHLLTRRVIKEIRTASEVFRSGDNILAFILQAAMSTQYSLDLENIVRDRIAAKVARGEYPQRAPEGYLNNPFLHSIEPDDKRFPLIQRAFNLMATGTYSVERLARVMNEEWGYLTRQAYYTGGGPISKSSLHRLLHDPFYTGHFRYKGVLHPGKHEPMISWETFDAVQQILGREGKKRDRKRSDEFSFAGLLVCGACSRRVTAEVKQGRHGRGTYVYYHCSNYRVCKQRAVREEVVEAAVSAALDSVRVDPGLRDMCIENIEQIYRDQSQEVRQELEQRHRAQENAEERMSRLVQMGIKGLLDDSEFAREKRALQEELNGLRKSEAMSQGRLEKAREGALEIVDFVTKAPEEFRMAEATRRREIAGRLGAVYQLKDGQIQVELHRVLIPLVTAGTDSTQTANGKINKGYTRRATIGSSAVVKHVIEPRKVVSGSRKADLLKSAIPLGWEGGTLTEAFRKVFERL